MSKYVIFVVIMVLMTGIFHMLFIGYDYIFHHPDEGIVSILSDEANESMRPYYRSRWENTSNFLRDAFGMSRVICIGLAIAVPVIGAVKKPRGE